jgi:mannose/fructose/N-acetylgalactosamine-specific phosphotransferase system component IIC
MVSRPIFAATLGGAMLGDPGAGFLVGAALELLGLGHTPYGAAVYPETGPAALVAGAALAGAGGVGIGPLAVAIASGLIIGWVGAASVRLQRKLNERLLVMPGAATPPTRIERRHRLAIALDGTRAGLLTAAVVLPVMLLVDLAAERPLIGPAAGESGVTVASSLLLAGIAMASGVGAGVMQRRRTVPLLLGAGAAIAVLAIVLRS